MQCDSMRRILNISLLIFISTECHGARPMRIKCQNPDARIKVNFQPSVMCNTWPSTALCERRLDPPLQSDLQLRPCFIMALTHNSSTQRSLGNARLGLIWSDSIFWRRQALSPWRCGSGSARTERNLSLNMSPCAIWTCKWVCFFFFLQKWVRRVKWVMEGKKRKPFMYYQMFPFRNSTLFSILSLKRMCSRLYPAC